MRQRFVETLRDTTTYITGGGFVDGLWDVPIIAVENVCPRSGFDYLLTTPADVRQLRAVATEHGLTDTSDWMYDVGHATDPVAMLSAMEAPSSIHLHGVPDAAPAMVPDGLSVDIDPDALVVEPADGTVQHLPPHRVPERTNTALN